MKKPKPKKITTKAPVSVQQGKRVSIIERTPSGIEGLDELLGGGFEKKSIIVVVGGPGTGKTLMAAEFLYNGATKYGEPGVLLNLEQTRENFKMHMLQMGMDIERLEMERKIIILSYSPNEIVEIIKGGGGLIKDAIDSIGAKRLAIDSLTALISFYERSFDARRELARLFASLRGWGITTLATVESHIHESHSKYPFVEFLSDGVVLLRTYYEGNVRNYAIEILKVRGTEHSRTITPYQITNEGVYIFAGEEVFSK
ncbi:MAG: RAD55 family ATPase [Candidatus Micrarchaeia archaeon]